MISVIMVCQNFMMTLEGLSYKNIVVIGRRRKCQDGSWEKRESQGAAEAG